MESDDGQVVFETDLCLKRERDAVTIAQGMHICSRSGRVVDDRMGSKKHRKGRSGDDIGGKPRSRIGEVSLLHAARAPQNRALDKSGGKPTGPK